jgi:hypothetical protein
MKTQNTVHIEPEETGQRKGDTTKSSRIQSTRGNFMERRFILHLVPADSEWKTRLEKVRSEVLDAYGDDSSYDYHIHCSLTSFFSLSKDSITSFCDDFITACATHTSTSPVSTAASSPTNFHPNKSLTPLVELSPPLCTPDGCVIFPVHVCPHLKQLIALFSVDKSLRPKPINHVSLAKNRDSSISAAIARLYVPLQLHPPMQPWDVVLLEQVQHRKFEEHLRMPLHSLLYH